MGIGRSHDLKRKHLLRLRLLSPVLTPGSPPTSTRSPCKQSHAPSEYQSRLVGRGGLEPPASAVNGPERCVKSGKAERMAGCYQARSSLTIGVLNQSLEERRACSGRRTLGNPESYARCVEVCSGSQPATP